jgi:hypothetical protein
VGNPLFVGEHVVLVIAVAGYWTFARVVAQVASRLDMATLIADRMVMSISSGARTGEIMMMGHTLDEEGLVPYPRTIVPIALTELRLDWNVSIE